MPRMIIIKLRLSIIEFVILKDKLPLIISIISLTIIKKYRGIKLLIYNPICNILFFIFIFFPQYKKINIHSHHVILFCFNKTIWSTLISWCFREPNWWPMSLTWFGARCRFLGSFENYYNNNLIPRIFLNPSYRASMMLTWFGDQCHLLDSLKEDL